MGIKSPATYGDYYWAKQVEAATFLAEETEKEFSAMSTRLMGKLRIREVLPDELQGLFSELEAPAGAFMGEIGGRFVSEVADGAVSKTANPLLESIGYLSYMRWPTKKLTPEATATLYARKKIPEEFFLERFRMGGFEPIEAKFQFDAMRPYPSISDFVLYSRYHADPDAPWGEIQNWFDISPKDWPVWKWLGLQRLTTLQAQTLYRRGIIERGQFYFYLSQIGWSGDDKDFVEQVGWTIPNAMLLVQGNLQQGEHQDKILTDISIADINPEYAQTYLNAILTKPASTDLVAYQLRKDPDLSGLDTQLRKIGIHPDYFNVYRELAYQIPPVADIITMAVREAFTPEIAARFGQYEDFPAPFAEWAAKKGLSPEWSERYWAAHWSLPSAQQGFEMLHRGVISVDDLHMLLRALDVMPFWRDKLTQIAYRRLTRVDIRRMYKVGVITQGEVYESYLQHGYTDKNAERMTAFTVQWAMPKEASITRSDILTAYKNRMITRGEAADLLADMGEEYFHFEFMLKAVDYKRDLELTGNKIKGIRNLYKKRVYDPNKTIDELLKLDLPSDEVNDLMEQWYFEIKAEPVRHWTTAQTLSFIKDGLITRERGIIELQGIGYDSEHINIYLESLK